MISRGVRNLAFDCAGLVPGQSILVAYENPQTGWWSADLVDTLIRALRDLGFTVESIMAEAPANRRDDAVLSALMRHDCTIFLARIGDQDRFAEPPAGKTIAVCYLRDIDMLASDFGGLSFTAMKRLKRGIDELIFSAGRIEIQCPQGTKISGPAVLEKPGDPADVAVLRFPLGIGAPVGAGAFCGRVALSGYLTPTGSRVYQPATLRIDAPVQAVVERGKILRFDGPPESVEAIVDHYTKIGDEFAIDPFVVHSWHAGIHPGQTWRIDEDEDPDLWSNSVFNHPRFLHFHTCGDYPPGEISWMLKDHTVRLDGVAMWERGYLRPGNFESLRPCLADHPQLAKLFDSANGSSRTR